MGKLRISIVEFLNTAPLVWGFTDGPIEGRYDLSFTVPSLCADALRSGQADIAIIPAIEYQRMEGMVVLPEMAIASKGEVRSLLVLAKKPIQFVKRLALDTNSRSTVALTRLLCRGLWGIAPEFIDDPQRPRAYNAAAQSEYARLAGMSQAALMGQGAGTYAALTTSHGAGWGKLPIAELQAELARQGVPTKLGQCPVPSTTP